MRRKTTTHAGICFLRFCSSYRFKYQMLVIIILIDWWKYKQSFQAVLLLSSNDLKNWNDIAIQNVYIDYRQKIKLHFMYAGHLVRPPLNCIRKSFVIIYLQPNVYSKILLAEFLLVELHSSINFDTLILSLDDDKIKTIPTISRTVIHGTNQFG